MARGDAEIRVGVKGAQQAKGELDKVAEGEKRVGRAGQEGGEKASRGMRGLSGAMVNAATAVKSLVAGFIGVQGLIRALGKVADELREIDEISRRTFESLRGIMALSQVQGATKETKQAVEAFARATGRSTWEVAPAYYTFMGGTAGLAPERQQALLKQAALFYKTDPTANLASVVGLFSTLGTQQPQLKAQQIGNILSRTIEQAKATPQEMAQYLPNVLSAAKAGGADLATAMAMFSLATRAGGGVAKSGTAVTSLLMGLLTPAADVGKQLGAYGYKAGATLEEKVGWLAGAGEKLPAELQAQLGGRRGLEAVAALASQPQAFRAEVAGAHAALTGQRDQLADRLRSMYGEDEAQRYLQQIFEAEVIGEQFKTSDKAMMEQAELKLTQRLLEEGGSGTVFRWLVGLRQKHQRLVGRSPMAPYESEGLYGEAFEMLHAGASIDDILIAFRAAREADMPTGIGAGQQAFRRMVLDRGIERMQGGPVIVNNGGTLNYNADRQSPAGRPNDSRIGQ